MTRDELLISLFGDYAFQVAEAFPDKTDDELVELMQKVDKDFLENIHKDLFSSFSLGEWQLIEFFRSSEVIHKYNIAVGELFSKASEYFVFLDSNYSEVRH